MWRSSRARARAHEHVPGSLLRRLRARCVEVERRRVEAVTEPRWLRAVREDVAQVCGTARAMHFGAGHAQRPVFPGLDHLRIQRLGEAWPSGAGFKLGI